MQLQPHVPALHPGVELGGPAGHTCVHMPQLSRSVALFTQEMLGSLPHASGVVPVHVTPHVLAVQVVVPVPATGPGHAWEQAPQLLGSLDRFWHDVGDPAGQPL